MSPEEKDVAQQRLSNARQALSDARLLAAQGSSNAAMNRMYYACFYAIGATLYAEGISTRKHTGLRAAFNRDYVHTGKVSPNAGDLFNKLFDRRMECDYEDFADASVEEVAAWLPGADSLVGEIEALMTGVLDREGDST